jgi:membrane fusion protein, multidrug efflux system
MSMEQVAQNEPRDEGKAPAPPPPKIRPRKRRFVIFALLLLLILAGAVAFLHKSVHQSTDDAYVHGNQVFLMPRIPGTVVAIEADDTDLVQKGQPVVILDDSDAKVSLQQAEAALGDTMRKVRQFYANVEELKANLNENKTALKRAEDDYHRRTTAAHGTVAVEDITHAEQALDVSRAALQAAEEKLVGTQAIVANVDLEHHPMVLQAGANVLDAELTLLRTTITAPETGYVIRRNVQVGQRVAVGTPLLIIVPLNQIWVDANYKETELKNVRIGQSVSLTSDFYGSSVKYKGHVVGLAPSTGAAFSLLPPDEGSGNWIKIMQRVPVRILFDKKQLEEFPLRIGLSVKTLIDTADNNGAKLATATNGSSAFSTDVYSNEWTTATQLVQKLVATNLKAVTSLPDFSLSPLNQKSTPGNPLHE